MAACLQGPGLDRTHLWECTAGIQGTCIPRVKAVVLGGRVWARVGPAHAASSLQRATGQGAAMRLSLTPVPAPPESAIRR